ncbi:ornithine carbamoyltransferase [Saccharothrix violaceirubra]|uniref:Ornithine carbamoyltransferase n=1 Tax=Saccharothrix violaceirubra TaxID=413306 RepID=A0A7W7T649_9PSEU|nr:ornithine carbamoyltransferase [Saccharothrix violaceirubra]MBB4967281.1 ornithine carbamoyltransferase [Saccharothrix violaceirubra]
MNSTGGTLISVTDLTDGDLRHIVDQGVRFGQADAPGRPLHGRVVGVYFSKTSTRTRTAFTSGALRLGADVIAYGPNDLQLNTGESIADTGRVFAGMLDLLVARTAGAERDLRELAASGLPVVNAMSELEHPTQALADLTTLTARFGTLDGLRLLYVGEGNNTCTALALALSRFPGVHFEARTPPGYGMPASIVETAVAQAASSGAVVVERHDMDDLPADVRVVYTTRWQTTGTSKPDPDWRTVFAPFQVHDGLFAGSPDALFMHDLPAHRGEEVTAEVLDGPRSIAFEQARYKMFSAMAVVQWSLLGVPSQTGAV